MGEDVADQVRDGCVGGIGRDGDFGFDVGSAVLGSCDGAILYEREGGGVLGVAQQESLRSEKETDSGLSAERFE